MAINNNFYVFIVLVVVAGLLFMPLPLNNLWWREALNSGHTILFLVIPFALYYPLNERCAFSNKFFIYVYILFIGMLLGVLIEVLQSCLERDTSLYDVYRNFLGISSGLFFLAAYNLNKSHYKKTKSVYFIVLGVGLLSLGLMPLANLSWHYIERNNAFPVIIDFTAGWSESFVRLSNTEIQTTAAVSQWDNDGLYRIQFNKGHYPGISIIEPEPDWSNYQQLRFKIHSAHKYNKNVILRVHDEYHNNELTDRYNKKLVVAPGLNEYVIELSQVRNGPAGRELDLSSVAGLILFSIALEEPLQLEFSNIYLE